MSIPIFESFYKLICITMVKYVILFIIYKFSTEKFLFSKTLPSVYFIPYANFHAITISNDLHIINQQIMFRYTYYEQ